jgi:hypothetical protein
LDAEEPLPFDHIRIREGREARILSARELLALPIHTRVRWLLDESLQFFRGDTLVDRRLALAALRRASVPNGSGGLR